MRGSAATYATSAKMLPKMIPPVNTNMQPCNTGKITGVDAAQDHVSDARASENVLDDYGAAQDVAEVEPMSEMMGMSALRRRGDRPPSIHAGLRTGRTDVVLAIISSNVDRVTRATRPT